MNEKYARVNRERSWSSPWGGCPCFLCHRFPFHPFSRASPPSPLPLLFPTPYFSRAKFIATGEKFLVEFNRLISLSQFDVREKIKTNRKRRQRSVRKRKPANSSLPANVIVGREMQRKRRVYPGRFPTVFLRIKRATYHPRFIWQPRQTPISLPATDFIESFALFVSVLDRSSGLWSRSRGNRGKMVKI